jgi:phosphatidylserine/phosphatidylglycerophosphate/cardiolipin synthase-like enzyme
MTRKLAVAAALLGGLSCAGNDAPEGDTGPGAGGKADDAVDARAFEVLLTTPHCDVCSSTDKNHLLANSAIVARILELVDGATTSIDVAQFTFSNRDIEAALLRAHERGVTVRMGMNAAQENGDTVSTRLDDAGIDVHFVEGKPANDFAGLQHAKYMLVDGTSLLMGSNNWSSTGTSINNENTVVLTSLPADPLLTAFACNFDAMFDGQLDEAATCSTDEVKFTPSSGAFSMIRDEIRLAEQRVDVLMHHLVFSDAVKLLAQTAERGVAVRVIVNAADRDEIKGSQWDRFFAAGGQVRFKQTNEELFQIMHDKLVVIDGRLLVNGSGNWSGSAFFNNYEFYVRHDQPEVVGPFADNFERLWGWSLTAASLDAGLTAAEQDAEATTIFFGNLHAHFSASDGARNLDDGKLEREVDGELVDVSGEVEGGDTARHAWQYARDVGGLDFMALSPHTTDTRVDDPADTANMNEEGFAKLVSIAAAVTEESGGRFVAIVGSEWSTNSLGNHVNVLGASVLPKTERGDFAALYDGFLPQRRAEGDRPIVMFNHPRTFRRNDEVLDGSWDQIFGVNLLDIERTGERTKKFNDYGLDDYPPLSDVWASWIAGDALPDEAVVDETLANIRTASDPYLRLMEVTVSRGNEFKSEVAQNPSLTVLEDGTVERFVKVDDWTYYLSHGFEIAPVASHDNHAANWGAGHTSRTAVIAPRLDETALMHALEQRAAYASEDENLQLRVYADDRVRAGQRLTTLADVVTLDVRLADPDFAGPFAVTVLLGTVGQSAVSAVQELSLEGEAWEEIPVPLPSAGDHFVIVQVHEPGPDRMAWSAPVFVTRP